MGKRLKVDPREAGDLILNQKRERTIIALESSVFSEDLWL